MEYGKTVGAGQLHPDQLCKSAVVIDQIRSLRHRLHDISTRIDTFNQRVHGHTSNLNKVVDEQAIHKPPQPDPRDPAVLETIFSELQGLSSVINSIENGIEVTETF